MATKNSYYVGSVPSVVKNAPVKFLVNYSEFEPDSVDPANMWPHLYTFTPDLRQDLEPQYLLQISSMVANDYVSNANTRTMFALRYGLNSIASAPELTEIRVTSNNYQSFMALPRLEGLELRNKMLRFFFNWYSLLPQEPIGYPDLILNIRADEEQLKQWVKSLTQTGLIVGAGAKEYKREMGFGFSTGAFRLNPEKEDDAKRLLGLSDEQPDSRGDGISRIFLSYSTKDKVVAGRISDLLRSKYQVEVFLAHEILQVSQVWRERILEELEKCDFLIALVTKNYKTSKWTDQEVGNAIGRGKKVIPIFHQRKLHGFLEMYQGVALVDDLDSLVTRIGDDLELTVTTPG